jgi:hypothetical protein
VRREVYRSLDADNRRLPMRGARTLVDMLMTEKVGDVGTRGRPLNIFMNNNLAGFLFNGQKRPDRVKGVTAVKRSSNFNPLIQNYFSAGAWANPVGDPNALVSATHPAQTDPCVGFPTTTRTLIKVFSSKEGLNMRFETLFGNICNRTLFCAPNNNFRRNKFRHGQHTMQPTALDSVWPKVVLLACILVLPCNFLTYRNPSTNMMSDSRWSIPENRRVSLLRETAIPQHTIMLCNPQTLTRRAAKSK